MKLAKCLPYLAFAGAIALIPIIYQNCSGVSFRKNKSESPPPPPVIVQTKVIEVSSVSPPSAVSESAADVIIEGQNFVPEMKLIFGTQECASISVLSETQATCSLAATPTIGPVDVEATAPGRDRGLLLNGFEWTMTIAQKCASPNHRKNKVSAIAIPAQAQQCAFAMADNLPVQQGIVTARVEQNINIDIPNNTAICEMQFQFLDQQLRYDDTFILALNSVILVSSHHGSSTAGIAPNANGFLLYNWLMIRGRPWTGGQLANDSPYCLVVSNNMGRCALPHTDQLQTMSSTIA